MWFFPHSCGHSHLCMSMVLPKCIWLKPHVMVISTHVAFLPKWFIHGNNQTYVEMLEFCLVGLGSPVLKGQEQSDLDLEQLRLQTPWYHHSSFVKPLPFRQLSLLKRSSKLQCPLTRKHHQHDILKN